MGWFIFCTTFCGVSRNPSPLGGRRKRSRPTLIRSTAGMDNKDREANGKALKETDGEAPKEAEREVLRRKLKKERRRFRVLIIGRANAGKSTILKRICDTIEEPDILDAKGNKIDPSVLLHSQERGEHDIENEMVFRSAPDFSFHDSRGFEAGGIEELEKAKAFINARAQAKTLSDQLQAIWYCIPLDNSRPFTKAERQFFSELNTGRVPVIVIFTKFDALVRRAFALLRKANYSDIDAMTEAPNHAKAEFDRIYPDLIYKMKHPPKGHVYLQKMHEAGADCSEPLTKTVDVVEGQGLRQRFRILIIGRANAGKSTILKRICDTIEEPEIYTSWGRRIDSSVLSPSRERGEHDIENEMVFESAPDFRFHDSRGFEAGGIEELNKAKAFITARAQAKNLSDQLHAIWYCIPLDNSRPFTAAERQFFSECSTGDVPVIVIFTKFDALVRKAFGLLKEANYSRGEALTEAPNRAKVDFDRIYPDLVYKTNYPPKGHVCLQKMHVTGADCSELVRKTADALDNQVLQQLFVSTQRNNLALCKEYAIQHTMMSRMAGRNGSIDVISFVWDIWPWFPRNAVS